MSTFVLDLDAVRRAVRLWDDEAEVLRGARTRIVAADDASDALGDRAGPVAHAYLTTWSDHVENLRKAAQARSDGLATFTTSAVHLDQAAADDLRATLPWEDRGRIREKIGDTMPFPTDDPGPSPSPQP